MCIYIYTHTHINAHICACTHIFYTHTHTYMYITHTHINAHTCARTHIIAGRCRRRCPARAHIRRVKKPQGGTSRHASPFARPQIGTGLFDLHVGVF